MTNIPIHVPPRPEPKPTCYVCGNPCIDAGDKGELVPRLVPSNGRFVGRMVRACANCREDNE